uniref:Peptidase M12B domain-containing protein n=1 Tax=Amblyomma maculatum TaxID=34609 RepID=G3ML27_AMBMU
MFCQVFAGKSGVHFTVFLIISAATTLTSSSEISESTIVYPHVYEDRQEASEKVLLIHDGYSLNLRKASVLAKNLLLQDINDDGISEIYVDGTFYERHLYQDTRGEASLIIKPSGNGHYDVSGLLNFTHRIEPGENSERSLSGARAHRIFKIPFKDGIHHIAEVVEDKTDWRQASAHAEKRAFPDDITIELFYMSDYVHTSYFGNRTEERIQYATVMMHSVSLRTQQLETPSYIALTAIVGSFTKNESYVKLTGSDQLIGTETVYAMSQQLWSNVNVRQSDVVYLATGRDIVGVRPSGISSEVLGIAYRGKACSRFQVAVGEDIPGKLSGIHTAAHELGHLLGSDHDGEGTSRHCSAQDGFLMNPYAGGRRSFYFSNCSKTAISTFMASFDAFCLEYDWSTHIFVLPDSAEKLPGAVINGTKYCEMYFGKTRNVTYVKWDSDLLKCKFRCKIGVKKNGDPEYAIRFAFDGTPCNRFKPAMVCKNTVCVRKG